MWSVKEPGAELPAADRAGYGTADRFKCEGVQPVLLRERHISPPAGRTPGLTPSVPGEDVPLQCRSQPGEGVTILKNYSICDP